VSDMTIETNSQAVDDLDAYFSSLEQPAHSGDPEFDQAELDALIAELANGAPETTYDLSNFYLEGEPDLSAMDTQETQVDPQAVEAWLDSLEQSQSFEMDL
jgi:hypothetical protein